MEMPDFEVLKYMNIWVVRNKEKNEWYARRFDEKLISTEMRNAILLEFIRYVVYKTGQFPQKIETTIEI
jgi:ABC-type metal ion transport system substrate-binding protein